MPKAKGRGKAGRITYQERRTLNVERSRRWAVDKVDDVADVLFVGHALESFVRESNQGTEVFRDLAIKFEAGAWMEFAAAGDRFQGETGFRWRD